MPIVDLDSNAPLARDLVGPILRAGRVADAAIDAVEADNPGRDVYVLDRGDYIRVHTVGRCHLTRSSLEQALGRRFPLAALELELPSFAGRLATHTSEYIWYYESIEEHGNEPHHDGSTPASPADLDGPG